MTNPSDASRPAPAAPLPRSQATARQWLVYAAIRIAVWPLAVLPLSWVIAAVRGLARLWHVLDRRHRKRMEDALARSLGLDAGAARDVAARVYPHFAAALVEFLRLSRLPRASQEACVRYDIELADRIDPRARRLVCDRPYRVVGIGGGVVGLARLATRGYPPGRSPIRFLTPGSAGYARGSGRKSEAAPTRSGSLCGLCAGAKVSVWSPTWMAVLPGRQSCFSGGWPRPYPLRLTWPSPLAHQSSCSRCSGRGHCVIEPS